MMDREFELVKDLVPLVEINTMAVRKYVGLIERKIRVIKEKSKSFQQPLSVCKYTCYGADTLCVHYDILAECISGHVRKQCFFPQESLRD